MQVPNLQPRVRITPRIALIGEAPGEVEVKQGRPFVGPSGQLLNSMLQEAKILRNGCFIGNCYQFRPHANNMDTVSRSSGLWKTSVETLEQELLAFDPDITVAFGKTALEVLAGKDEITNWRGSLLKPKLEGLRGYIIPTYHPAYVLRQYNWRPIVVCDLEKAKIEADNPQPLPSRTHLINPTFDQVGEELDKLHSVEEFAFDFETNRITATPLCLGFAPKIDYSFTIPFDERWTWQEEFAIVKEIERILMNKKVGKIAQNAQFDISVAAKAWGMGVRNLVMDTMLAHHACYADFPKSLAFQTSIYTRQPYYKDMHKSDNEKAWDAKKLTESIKEKFYIYNGIDCCITLEIAQILRKELTKVQAWGGYRTDMNSLPCALEMTWRGIRFDQDRANADLIKLDKQIEANQKLVDGTFGRPINVKSTKDMRELLYDPPPNGLGLPVQYKIEKGHKTNKVTADAGALIKLAKQFQGKGLEFILKTRQIRTAQAFYKPKVWTDGRVHAGFNVAGTETGRWSSSGSIWLGRNIMNYPDGTRPPFYNPRVIFASDPGKIMLYWDKAQAEARVVAYKAWAVSDNSVYKNIVESGEKIHVWFGKRLVEAGICPISQEEFVERKSSQAEVWYYISKVSVHGFSYDLGPEKWAKELAKNTDGAVLVELRVAKKIKAALYDTLSSIPAWHQQIKEFLETHAIMYNPFGRARVLMGRRDMDLFREAYAYEPQSTVADDVARAIARVRAEVPELELMQQNYDSLLGQCNKGEELELAKRISKVIQDPIKVIDFHGKEHAQFSIPVEFKVGYNWGELKDIKV